MLYSKKYDLETNYTTSILNKSIEKSIHYVNDTHKVYYRNIPYDHKIEYLQSSGTQYIDTGIVPSNNIVIYCKFKSSESFIFGCRTALNNKEYSFLTAGNNNESSFRFGNKYTPTTIAKLSNNIVYELYSSLSTPNIVTVKNLSTNEITTYTVENNTFNCDYSCHIFGINMGGTHGNGGASQYIYEFKLYCSDRDLLHLIPVRKSNIGYMYDKISNQLFGNNGTGNFVLGPDIYI